MALNRPSIEDCAALLVSEAMTSAQNELMVDSLPTQCFCGLADADRVRKWVLCLTRQIYHGTHCSATPEQVAMQKMLLKSLETALQQHLSICFQMKDEDGLVYSYMGQQPSHEVSSRSLPGEVSLPVSVSLQLPQDLVRHCRMDYHFTDPFLDEDRGTWNAQMNLHFTPPGLGSSWDSMKEDKMVQVSEEMLGLLRQSWTTSLPSNVSSTARGRRSLVPALDLRKKQAENKLILPEGFSRSDSMEELDIPDWEKLERLEIEAWEDLDAVSPLQRQTSFYNYMKILNKTLSRYKKELEKWDRIAQNHFDVVKANLTKDKLQEIVQNRLLRQDIKQEITYLEEQIQHRAVIVERKDNGNENTKPLVDRETSRSRFARSTRTIAEMIEVLREQVESQIQHHSTVNGQPLSAKAEDYEHFV